LVGQGIYKIKQEREEARGETMKRFERFANEHPVTFGLVCIVIYILMLIISAILGNLWPGEEIYGQPGNMLGRLISIAILLVLLSRLGWLRSAGLMTFGNSGIWVISVLLLAYSVAGYMVALTGNFGFSISTPSVLVTSFILAQSFMEEIVFRGLILRALVRAWGSTRIGINKSILVSALFFCSIHVFDFLSGRPLSAVLLQSLEAFFLGIALGALVLSGKSIYPAAFFHSILNLGAYLIFAYRGLEPSSASWLLLSLVMVPPAIFGLYFLNMSYHSIADKQPTRNIKEAL
jgi:membrane protease YdiL (CAAX protease family)